MLRTQVAGTVLARVRPAKKREERPFRASLHSGTPATESDRLFAVSPIAIPVKKLAKEGERFSRFGFSLYPEGEKDMKPSETTIEITCDRWGRILFEKPREQIKHAPLLTCECDLWGHPCPHFLWTATDRERHFPCPRNAIS